MVGQAYRKDKKDTIEGLKGKLGELRKELGEALLIQIDKKVDGIDGKLNDVLERIPKKRILEGMYNDTTSSFISINLLNRVGEQTKADAGDWLRSKSFKMHARHSCPSSEKNQLLGTGYIFT